MNLSRIDEYAGDSEFDLVFLTEVAKRVDAIWGHVRNESAAGAAVSSLYFDTLVFRDGFKVNHGQDVNSFVGVDGAAAVMAAVWDWMGIDWRGMEKCYPETGSTSSRSKTRSGGCESETCEYVSSPHAVARPR